MQAQYAQISPCHVRRRLYRQPMFTHASHDIPRVGFLEHGVKELRIRSFDSSLPMLPWHCGALVLVVPIKAEHKAENRRHEWYPTLHTGRT